MEIKKNESMDLENKRTTRFLLGLILALALLLAALEYSVDTNQEAVESEEFSEMICDPDLQLINIMEEQVVLVPEKKVETPEIINVVDEQEETVQQEQPEETAEQPDDLWEETELEQPIAAEPPAIELDSKTPIFYIVEEMPQFPGGPSAFIKWLTKNLRYPLAAKRQKIEGKVLAHFIVEPDGSISDIRIIQSLHPACDNEARRVLTMMPKWKAGIMNKQPCRTQVCLPIVFRM